MKILASFATLGLMATGFAQSTQVRAGYFWGSSFSGTTKSIRLEGVDVGVDFSLYKLPGGLGELRFSPSVMFGGALRKGGDDDGTLYRLMVTGKVTPPLVGFYGVGGIGYGWAQPRGGAKFTRQNGMVAQVGVGFQLTSGLPLPVTPNIELSYYFGQRAQQGLLLGVSLKF